MNIDAKKKIYITNIGLEVILYSLFRCPWNTEIFQRRDKPEVHPVKEKPEVHPEKDKQEVHSVKETPEFHLVK